MQWHTEGRCQCHNTNRQQKYVSHLADASLKAALQITITQIPKHNQYVEEGLAIQDTQTVPKTDLKMKRIGLPNHNRSQSEWQADT